MKKPKINAIISGAIAKASGGDFTEGAFRAMVVWLYNHQKTLGESLSGLWHKIIDGTIARDATKGLKGAYNSGMISRSFKYIVFKGEEYNSLMKSDMPVYLKNLLKVNVTLIEVGLVKTIKDPELLMGYSMFSGYFSDTIPNSWAGYAGFYFRQYTDAFYVLPARGESYDIYNLSPVYLK